MIWKLAYRACIGLAALASLGVPLAQPAFAETPAPIHVDIPVVMKEAKVVINMSSPPPANGMPIGFRHMISMTDLFKKTGTKWKMVAVFFGPGGEMLLSDAKYNEVKWTKTGNPYKAMLSKLVARGVQIEECAVTMKAEGWTNKDLLPIAKVDVGGEARLVDLVQQGYVLLQN
ncbi:MAG: DsrE family protein [Methylovirgula sp.]